MFTATAGGLRDLVPDRCLAFGKILATSLSIVIGGSASSSHRSLFIGVTTGMAYGGVRRPPLRGRSRTPALYAVVRDGRGLHPPPPAPPLTSLSSVLEMTGDFLPPAAGHARHRDRHHRLPGASSTHHLHTKLLRRGTQDIDKPRVARARDRSSTDVMRPLPGRSLPMYPRPPWALTFDPPADGHRPRLTWRRPGPVPLRITTRSPCSLGFPSAKVDCLQLES